MQVATSRKPVLLVLHDLSIGKNTTNSEKINFWDDLLQQPQKHLLAAAMISTGYYASPRVGLVPVESLLRLWQT
jgi:hypothetical protein